MGNLNIIQLRFDEFKFSGNFNEGDEVIGRSYKFYVPLIILLPSRPLPPLKLGSGNTTKFNENIFILT